MTGWRRRPQNGSVKAHWLLFAIAVVFGCFHYPHEALLLSLRDQPGQTYFSSPQPKYLGFSDDRTEFVFKPIAERGDYEIAPDGSTLICPGVPADGMHGYMLRLDVDSVMGDSAIATLVQTCVRDPRQCPVGSDSCVALGSSATVTTKNYLLVKKEDKWAVEKPLNPRQ